MTTTATTTTMTTTITTTTTATTTMTTTITENQVPVHETTFLALDKPCKGREYLDVISIIPSKKQPKKLHYDLEWLSLIKTLSDSIPTTNLSGFKPPKLNKKTYQENYKWISENIPNNLEVPNNFVITVFPHYSFPEYLANIPKDLKSITSEPNIQTKQFTEKLGIPLPALLLLEKRPSDNMERNDRRERYDHQKDDRGDDRKDYRKDDRGDDQKDYRNERGRRIQGGGWRENQDS